MSDKNIFGLSHSGELTRGETNEMVPPVCDRIDIVKTAAHDTLALEIAAMPFNPQRYIDSLIQTDAAAPALAPQSPQSYSEQSYRVQPAPVSLVKSETTNNDDFTEGLDGAAWDGTRPSDGEILAANEAARTVGGGIFSRLAANVNMGGNDDQQLAVNPSPAVEVGMHGPTAIDQYISGIAQSEAAPLAAQPEPTATVTDLAAARYARQAEERHLAELRHNVDVARSAAA